METWVVCGDSALMEDPEAKHRLNSTAHWVCVGPFTNHSQAKEEDDRLHHLTAENAELRELLREGYEACCFGGSEESRWLDQLGEKIDEWDNLMSRAAIDAGEVK